MTYKNVFEMPANMRISSRTSTITNAFVSSILPSIEPQEDEIKKCLEILELDANDLRCAYCGDKATEWDHLRPLVSSKKPTGYVSEIRNLVPACGTCNQSKRNKNWDDWITSDVKGSPNIRKPKDDLNVRIQRLRSYEDWGRVSPIDLEKAVDGKLWDNHWQNLEDMHKEMKNCQELADKIRSEIEKKLRAANLRNS